MSALPTQTYLVEDPVVGGAVSIPSLSSGRRLECSKSCFLKGLRRLNDNIAHGMQRLAETAYCDVKSYASRTGRLHHFPVWPYAPANICRVKPVLWVCSSQRLLLLESKCGESRETAGS